MSEVLQQQQLPAILPVPLPEPVKKKNDPNAGMYRSLLNELAQKSSIKPPIYQTHNEGSQHQPQFRSRVWIEDNWYTSPNTFSQRKAAEMEVSRIAFLAIMQKRKDEGANLIREDTVFCKSILIEYAVRMNLEKPKYHTTQLDLPLPQFSSTLVFNGATYTGEFARNKMEAQRLAARAVILSILDTESGYVMSEIINSKFKLYAGLNKAKNSHNVQVGIMHGSVPSENNNDIQNNTDIQFRKENEEDVAPGANNNPSPPTINEPFPGQNTSIPAINLHHHVFQPPKPALPATITPAISLAPISEQAPIVDSTTAVVAPLRIVGPPSSEEIPLVVSTSGKKRNRRNKKKAQKKVRVEAQLPLDALRLTQIAPCSVAQ